MKSKVDLNHLRTKPKEVEVDLTSQLSVTKDFP